ncbi:hypothetical protein M0534_00280 [Methylonatrum kenyense]|uniref:hypothetical protein n=1 Tax=Methylonatrum kenyense TaxID=455253 RepID=UPI0020BEE9AD|nr:hypothetical protein [Methylonatrum kenyense]MCK8514768.1 hypothetical protein [Methylonatrum kenyense]
MSDFLYSSRPMKKGLLAAHLQKIYLNGTVDAVEYHGSWGSLAVTQSTYNGFDPVETDRHICVVIGGPVLRFTDNAFLAGTDRQAGTRAILKRWRDGPVNWSEDLSGPFVALLVDKITKNITCITDLMLFIPVYSHVSADKTTIGTHVDALARAVSQETLFDAVSLADFVLHHVITYPYTAYENVRQFQPATAHCIDPINGVFEALQPYWRPEERTPFRKLNDAATALRNGVTGDIARITGPMDHVAHFISGGEDSRALAGMLPRNIKRDAIVFLDRMNREGRVARKAAAAYGAEFRASYRDPLHYLDILPEAATLVGAGHQCIHAHALGLDETRRLAAYPAVFGGYLADTLLKAVYARQPKVSRQGWIPQVMLPGEARTAGVRSPFFPDDVLAELTLRRRDHLDRILEFRPVTAHEWFETWPMTMRVAVPNLYSNRRLFPSYEPFMSHDAVKVSAAAPTQWKMNHRLFHRAFRPYLRRSRFVRHADGRFPYYPWWVNAPIRFGTLLGGKIGEAIRPPRVHQGPWNDWGKVQSSPAWEAAIRRASVDAVAVPVLQTAIARNALADERLDVYRKVNLLQLSHHVRKNLHKR